MVFLGPVFNERLQTDLQSNQMNHIPHGTPEGRGPYPEQNVIMHNRTDSSNNYSFSSDAESMSFKERYNYPENSLYYQENQLLNSLFLERQTRQHDPSL